MCVLREYHIIACRISTCFCSFCLPSPPSLLIAIILPLQTSHIVLYRYVCTTEQKHKKELLFASSMKKKSNLSKKPCLSMLFANCLLANSCFFFAPLLYLLLYVPVHNMMKKLIHFFFFSFPASQLVISHFHLIILHSWCILLKTTLHIQKKGKKSVKKNQVT